MPMVIIFGASRRPRRTARRSVAQVGEEVVAGVEALRRREAHVVGVERVGHHQVRHRACRRSWSPASRTAGRRRSSRCRIRSRRGRPPGGACWGCRGRCTSPAATRRRSGRSMIVGADVDVAGARWPRSCAGSGSSASRGWRSRGRARRRRPSARGSAAAPSTTPNTVSGRPRCSNSRRMRHTPTREPYSYIDSIVRWRVLVGLRGDQLGQEGLRRRVAVQHVVLAAFFVVEHELHRDACAAGPVRVRRRCGRSRAGRAGRRRRSFMRWPRFEVSGFSASGAAPDSQVGTRGSSRRLRSTLLQVLAASAAPRRARRGAPARRRWPRALRTNASAECVRLVHQRDQRRSATAGRRSSCASTSLPIMRASTHVKVGQQPRAARDVGARARRRARPSGGRAARRSVRRRDRCAPAA